MYLKPSRCRLLVWDKKFVLVEDAAVCNSTTHRRRERNLHGNSTRLVVKRKEVYLNLLLSNVE